MQITIDIPQDIEDRLRAVMMPGKELDGAFGLTVLKLYLGQQEFRRWAEQKQKQGEAEARQKAEELNKSLGLAPDAA